MVALVALFCVWIICFLIQLSAILYNPFCCFESSTCHKLVPYCTPMQQIYKYVGSLTSFKKCNPSLHLCPSRISNGWLLVDQSKTSRLSNISTIRLKISDVINPFGDHAQKQGIILPRNSHVGFPGNCLPSPTFLIKWSVSVWLPSYSTNGSTLSSNAGLRRFPENITTHMTGRPLREVRPRSVKCWSLKHDCSWGIISA